LRWAVLKMWIPGSPRVTLASQFVALFLRDKAPSRRRIDIPRVLLVSAVWNFPLGIPCYEARINLQDTPRWRQIDHIIKSPPLMSRDAPVM
jgi:hypothetical protein